MPQTKEKDEEVNERVIRRRRVQHTEHTHKRVQESIDPYSGHGVVLDELQTNWEKAGEQERQRKRRDAD